MDATVRRWIWWYQLAAGGCDAATGVLLVAAPTMTLGLMGLTVKPEPLALVRYVGVFVLAVGLSYLWLAAEGPAVSGDRWRTQWQITALVRTLVALFVSWQVAVGGLEARWLSVAATDATFAAVQWLGLSRGWFGDGE